MYYRSLLKSHEHPCIDNQCLSLQIQRYLCPIGSALKSIFGVVNDKCAFILLACFPKLGHPLCLLCFCFFIFHNPYLSFACIPIYHGFARKITTIFRYTQVFPDFCKIYLSNYLRYMFSHPLKPIKGSLKGKVLMVLYTVFNGGKS